MSRTRHTRLHPPETAISEGQSVLADIVERPEESRSGQRSIDLGSRAQPKLADPRCLADRLGTQLSDIGIGSGFSPNLIPQVTVQQQATASETPVRITGFMNYDETEIPTTYDKARALVPETRRLWQDLLSVHIDRAEMSLVIDLGCGTGRFSGLLAAHFGVQVIGIDPSLKMVDQARRKPKIGNVVYWQGSAALPLRNGCADLVFMSMVYHHLTDPTAVARE